MTTSAPAEGTAVRPHLGYVDGLRALAALAVLWTHGIACANRMCAGIHDGWRDTGDRGVELFFVVSGFCLAYPFLARRQAGRPLNLDYLKFMVRRFSRIIPPYYVILFILGLFALTPIGYPGNASLSPIPAGLAAVTFLRDLVFDTSGWQLFNLAFWTLGVEMHWYFVCPLLILLYVRAPAAFLLTMPLLYALSFFPPFGLPHVFELATLPCFMLGILAADLSFDRKRALRYSLYVLPAVAFIEGVLHQVPKDFADPGWHLLPFLLVVMAASGPLARFFSSRAMVLVGFASYSIYLVHLPVLGFFERRGITSWAATLIALACGFLFWYYVERPFLRPEVRGKIEVALTDALARLKVGRPQRVPAAPPASSATGR